MAMSATGVGKGGGVMDKPVIEKTTPGRESEFDVRYHIKLFFTKHYFRIKLLVWGFFRKKFFLLMLKVSKKLQKNRVTSRPNRFLRLVINVHNHI